MEQSEFLKTAIKAAKAAGEIIKHYNNDEIKRKSDSPGDVVTQADLESEKVIIKIIKESFPNHKFISEEFNPDEKLSSDYTWIIDPIDGTLPFTLGYNYSAVSIGLFKDKQPILGVIYHPLMEMLYYAEKGKGAFIDNKQISVNNQSILSKSLIYFGCPIYQRKEAIENILLKLADKIGGFMFISCATSSLTNIASGKTELYIHCGNKIWDIAAGYLIINEAGGRTTNLKGDLVDFTKDKIDHVFSNGKIHDEVIKIINQGDN